MPTQEKINEVKSTMRERGYSFHSFTVNGYHGTYHYSATLTVIDKQTLFTIRNSHGSIIYSEEI
jgi:hypothetical protein